MRYRSVFDERMSAEYSGSADHLKPSTEQVVEKSKLTDAEYMRDYLRIGLRDRGAKLFSDSLVCRSLWEAVACVQAVDERWANEFIHDIIDTHVCDKIADFAYVKAGFSSLSPLFGTDYVRFEVKHIGFFNVFVQFFSDFENEQGKEFGEWTDTDINAFMVGLDNLRPQLKVVQEAHVNSMRRIAEREQEDADLRSEQAWLTDQLS